MQTFAVHPVNGEVPPVKGRPWKLPHYANRGKTSSSGGELRWPRLVGQLGGLFKVYSDCHSYRQNLLG